jgi:uncharacterized protein (DUF2141 family)
MKWFIYLVLGLLHPLALAQGSIQGTISAAEVSGFMVIACYADAEVGCNESLSSLSEISAAGTGTSYNVGNLSAGQYIVFLWRDSNNSGELEEDQDEIFYYGTNGEEVTLVSPPAQNIDFNVSSTPSAVNPIANPVATPVGSLDLTGSWSNYGYLGNYLDGNVTSKLDFLESSKAQSFIFSADGTYSSLGYDLVYDDYLDRYIACLWTKVEGTYTVQGDRLITQIQNEEFARCGNEFAPVDALTRTTATFVWRSEETQTGTGLGLLNISEWSEDLGKDISELSDIDEESNWMSGYAYHLVRD